MTAVATPLDSRQERLRAPGRPSVTRRCLYCDAPFRTRVSKDAVCCGKRCAALLRHGAVHASPLNIADCVRCSTAFVKRSGAIFCSEACRATRLPPEPVIRNSECVRCKATFTQVGLGRPAAHCKRCAKQAQRRQRRYRLRPGAKRERYSTRQIAERDGWRCHLCGRKVPDREFASRPLDPTVDHLVPLSLGGDDTPTNVALAHFRCNVQKGTKPVGEQLRLLG